MIQNILLLTTVSLAAVQAPGGAGALAREMSTDRPDATESPYTVPAGRWQIELSVVEHSRDDAGGVSGRETSWLGANVKLGLGRNLDLQLVVNPYVRRVEPGVSTPAAGVGDLQVRAKLSLIGNDGGPVAFALMPFVTVPSGASAISNGHVEGGLILPVAVSTLPLGLDLGMMAEVDVNRTATDQTYGLNLGHTITVGYTLPAGYGAFLEYAGSAALSTGRAYLGFLDTGITFRPAGTIQFDAGVRLGIIGAAEDLVLFAGLSFRR